MDFQISYSTLNNGGPIEPELSAKFIVDLIAKNKIELCLKMLKSKKKSLIMNYVKDIFPIPQISKKNSDTKKVDSEIETDIGSPVSNHHR